MSTPWLGTENHHHDRPVRQLLGELFLWLVRSLLWVGFTTAGTVLNIWVALMLLLLITPASVWGYAAVAFGAALVGCAGGLLIGTGQALALRRWLDGAASLGSFLSTLLASSAALSVGTVVGRWAHTVAGDLAGALTGVVAYGSIFGFVQRPMISYMARRSLLWVPVNVVASVLGAIAVLAAFDISGGRRDMLQFRYAGIVYSLVVGVAFLWMTRETRRSMALARMGHEGLTWGTGGSGAATGPVQSERHEASDPALLEIHEVHEHSVYRVYHAPHDSREPEPEDGEKRPDAIDATFRVIS